MNAKLAIKNLKMIIEDLDTYANHTADYNTEWSIRIEAISYELYKQVNDLIELEYILDIPQSLSA